MDVKDIPLDDQKTYDLLSSGQTLGCFQVDGRGMQGLLKKVRPRTIGDIAAVLALFRPGPIDNGSHTEFARRRNLHVDNKPDLHPEVDAVIAPILMETFGLIVYQEQVLDIIKVVTGWDYAEADLVFNAMRKKDLDKMEAARPGFLSASRMLGFSEDAALAVWGCIVPFADYSFNKAHAVSYAHISYYTAYLKANYPKQYMASVLTNESDADKLAVYLAEVQRLGIKILPPDINESDISFTPTKEGIRYGLSRIKGLGESASTAVRSSRPFSSISEFFRRADARVLNAGVLEALIGSGSLDSLWPDRESLLVQAPEFARVEGTLRKSYTREGQRPLWSPTYFPGSSEQQDYEARRQLEQEILGVEFSWKPVTLVLDRGLSSTQASWLQQILTPGLIPLVIISCGYTILRTTSSADLYQVAEILGGKIV